MSSYIRKLKNPVTKKEQVALCIDDFYGSHQYGYFFRKDGSDASFSGKLKEEDYFIFKEEELYD